MHTLADYREALREEEMDNLERLREHDPELFCEDCEQLLKSDGDFADEHTYSVTCGCNEA